LKLIFFIFLLIQTSFADIFVTDEKAVYNDFSIAYFFDDTQSMSIEDIQNTNFSSNTMNMFSFGYHHKTLWIKIKITNQSSSNQFVLTLNEPFWDRFDLYTQEADHWNQQRTGLQIPLTQRKVKDVFPSFSLELPKGKTTTVYLRGESVNGFLGSLKLYTSEEFYRPSRIDLNTLYFLYASVLFIVLILNILLYLATKEKLNTYYIGYLLSYIIFISMFSGSYLYLDLPGWSHGLHTVGAVVLMFMSLFSRSFLGIKAHSKKLNKLFKFFTVSFALFAFLMNLQIPYFTLIFNIFAFAFMSTLLILAINIPKERNSEIELYLYALVIYMPTMGMMALTFDSILFYTDITRFSFLLGGLIEVILFSLILGSRYHTLKFDEIRLQKELLKQKQKNEEELEDKIIERTTELQKTQEEYRLLFENAQDSKERFEAIFENSPIAYLLMEIEGGKIKDCNKAAEKLLKASKQQLVGLNPSDLSPKVQPDGTISSESVKPKIQKLLQKGHIEFEWKHKKLDGEEFWSLISLSTTIINGERLILSSWVDISLQKLFLQTIFDSTNAIIATITPDGIMNSINKFGEKFTGYSQEEIASKPYFWFDNFIPQDIQPDIKQILESMKESNTLISTRQNPWIRHDGELRMIEWSNSLVLDDNKEIQYLVTVGLDITVQKRQEEQLAQLNEKLELKVAEQLEEIRQQEAVMVSQQRLVQMGEMISMIAHQWRQPLSVISSIATAMKVENSLSENFDEKLDNNLSKINETVQILSGTINDFRDFYVSSKDLDDEDIIVSTNRTVSIVKDLYASKHGINIKCTHSTQSCFCKIVESEYMQVLLNLLSNAKDALVEQKTTDPQIFIKTLCSAENISIILEDNGGGIPEDILEKIFDPYFSTKGLNGTGIGLYMSYMIITQHFKGNISAENIEGGARFIVDFPKTNS